MTIGRTIVSAIAAFANLHPVARAALIEWFEERENAGETCPRR